MGDALLIADPTPGQLPPHLAVYGAERVAEARSLYERACGRLLYLTRAAWVRWEELEPEGQARWVAAVQLNPPAAELNGPNGLNGDPNGGLAGV